MADHNSDSGQGQQAPQVFSTVGWGGGPVKVMFQPLSGGGGRAEVVTIPGADQLLARGGGPGPGSSSGAPPSGISMHMGWMWVIGQRPICRTRRIIGASDGTAFFVRSNATIDQIYFVGPHTSRVHLSTVPATIGRGNTTIDATHRYAECDGSVITVRNLDLTRPGDQEFWAAYNQAKNAAGAAGLGSE